MNNFLKGRFVSFRYAFRGLLLLMKTEHSIMAQTFIFFWITVAGLYYDINKQDWINQTFAIGLVLSIEGLNTAIEKLADFVHIDHHPKIGFIKDIAAGAVTFAAITGLIIVVLIYYPYLKNYV